MQNQTSTESGASNQRSVAYNMGSNFCQTSKDIIADNAPKQVLPFCFVKYLRKYADPVCTIVEAVRLFEANDQPHLQISERITEKVFDRERLLSRLKDLKNYYLYRHNDSTEWKKNLLTHLNLALENLSQTNKPMRGRAIKSHKTEEEIDNKKLSFRMLHGTRNLAQEKQLFKDMSMCQKRDEASTSPPPELMKSLDEIEFKCSSKYYEQKNCDGLLREIKHFDGTRKNSSKLKESIRNQVKLIGDELMEMRKKKNTLERKIKHVEKEIEAINEEIWSFQMHLKDKYCRKDVSLFILEETKIDEYWVLKYSNLEDGSSFMGHAIYLRKSSSQARLPTFYTVMFS